MLFLKFLLRIPQFFLYMIVQIFGFIIRYPLAPIAVIFFSTPDKKHLTFFKFLETIDNDLGGDNGWQTVHIAPGSDPYSNWNRIGWLWRNGFDRIAYFWLGCGEAGCFYAFPPSIEYRYNSNGYWCIHKFFKIPFVTLWFEIYWGWSIGATLQGLNKITFTNRFRSAIDAGWGQP